MDSDLPLSETPLKTVKIRLFPTKEQRLELQQYVYASRWYYNAALTILYLEAKRTGKDPKDLILHLRDKILPKYEFTETLTENDEGLNSSF